MRGIDVEDTVLDPVEQLGLFRRCGMRLFLGRHQAGAHIFRDLRPQLTILNEGVVGFEFVERDSAFGGAIGMAVVTILRKKGFDFFLVLRDGGQISGAQREGKRDQPQAQQSAQ